MTEHFVAGADFSGAKTVPNDTWLAVARVGSLGVEIVDVRKVGAHALAKEVGEYTGIVAFGIDCPFSVPIEFANFIAAKLLRKDFQAWQELAQELVFISLEDFIEWVKEFKKEPKRFTDGKTPAVAISPLHRGNPSMVQMTYQGIRLLAMLDPKRFYVLPFQSKVPFGCAVIEVYPRATLKALHLPEVGYKSPDKKDEDSVRAVRAQILKGITSLRERKGITYANYPRLTISKGVEHKAIESDHALDAILCAYTTAAFSEAPALFPDPFDADNLDVLTEGWIYYMQEPDGKK